MDETVEVPPLPNSIRTEAPLPTHWHNPQPQRGTLGWCSVRGSIASSGSASIWVLLRPLTALWYLHEPAEA